jgi:hypothetical protein
VSRSAGKTCASSHAQRFQPLLAAPQSRASSRSCRALRPTSCRRSAPSIRSDQDSGGDDQDLFEQVGKNTNHLTHPAEILAEHFAMLVLGSDSPQSPEVLDKLRNILQQ